MMKNLSDYVYISQMGSNITDITDKIFGTDIKWEKHEWSDSRGKITRSDDIDVVYHREIFSDDEILHNEIFKYITQYGNTEYRKWTKTIKTLSDFRFNRYSSNTFITIALITK